MVEKSSESTLHGSVRALYVTDLRRRGGRAVGGRGRGGRRGGARGVGVEREESSEERRDA